MGGVQDGKKGLDAMMESYLLRWLRWKLAGGGAGDFAMITVRAIGDTCC